MQFFKLVGIIGVCLTIGSIIAGTVWLIGMIIPALIGFILSVDISSKHDIAVMLISIGGLGIILSLVSFIAFTLMEDRINDEE